MRTRTSPTPAAGARTLGTLLASVPPLLAMLAAGDAFWPAADTEQMSIAALALAPATHGAPIASLLAHAFTWLPLGPLPLRIALASSVAAAIAAGALYRAIETAARAGETPATPAVAAPLAVAFVLLAFGCQPLFFSAPHAYAAGIALACLGLERIAAARTALPAQAARPLRTAALWFGLLAIEQPALALCVLLGVSPSLHGSRLQAPARDAARIGLGGAAALAIALLVLATRDADRAQSAATTGAALWSGAYRLGTGTAAWTAALGVRSPAAWLLIASASLCAVRDARAPRDTQRCAPWIGVGLSALIASLVFARAEALLALALCCAAAICALTLIGMLGGVASRTLALAVGTLAIALGATLVRATALHDARHDHAAADALREPLLRALPPRSTALVELELAGMLHSAALEERVRPDVRVAIKPWRLDLPASEALAHAAPELQPALRAQLLQGELPVSELQSLAARQPVLIGLSTDDARTLAPALLPWGLYHQLSTSSATRNDTRFAARDADARLSTLPALLDADPPDQGCRHLLSDLMRAAAAYYAQVGDHDHADAASARASTWEQPAP